MQTAQKKVFLPSQYEKRYVVDYFLQRRKLDSGQEIRDMVAELASNLGVTPRTVYNWIKESENSRSKEISPEAMQVFADYLGLKPEQILTHNWSKN